MCRQLEPPLFLPIVTISQGLSNSHAYHSFHIGAATNATEAGLVVLILVTKYLAVLRVQFGCISYTKLSPTSGWVEPLPHVIFSYLQVAKLGTSFSGRVTIITTIIHWVCVLTTQGFLPSFIISGCVYQPPKFCYGVCVHLLPFFVFLIWGLSPLTVPFRLQSVSANHQVTCSGCVATTHSCCYPREHPVPIVPFAFMQLESENCG